MIRRASFMVMAFFVFVGTILPFGVGTISIGSRLDGFNLKDSNGTFQSYERLKGRKGTAVVFLSARCPVVTRYKSRINSIARGYKSNGIQFVGIYSAPPNGAEKSYGFKTLIDDRGDLAARLNARFTPEVFLFNEADILIYRGAIDDDYAGRGAKSQYLTDALNNALVGNSVALSTTRSFGCSLPRNAGANMSPLASERKPALARKSSAKTGTIVAKPLPPEKTKASVKISSGNTSKYSRTQNPVSYRNSQTAQTVNEYRVSNRSVSAKTEKRTRVSGFVTRQSQSLENDDAKLTKQLANPISPLIRVPIRVEYNDKITASGQSIWQINVEPVIPIPLGDSVNLISRTRVPMIQERDVPFQGNDRVGGLGDIEQTFLFSPSKEGTGGLSWGVGPAFLLNTS
ncbi:MAG: redoxin domain-containing protein, partial [Pyrinomonadaceae bacterium]|nr:redoxin domain-containing protein [Pyrinomonadaceae bacterium]